MVRSKDHEIHSLQNRVTTLTKDLNNKSKVSKNICTYMCRFMMCKWHDKVVSVLFPLYMCMYTLY